MSSSARKMTVLQFPRKFLVNPGRENSLNISITQCKQVIIEGEKLERWGTISDGRGGIPK